MTVPTILLPVFVEIALIFVLLFWMAALRQMTVRRGDLSFQDAALGSPWTGRTAQVTNSFNNQFQLPTLFFAAVILALVTHKADTAFVVLEWLFVAFRILHAAVHTGPNVVRVRGPLWGLSSFVLLIMWVWFALHILAGF
jgi:hypothetical protein